MNIFFNLLSRNTDKLILGGIGSGCAISLKYVSNKLDKINIIEQHIEQNTREINLIQTNHLKHIESDVGEIKTDIRNIYNVLLKNNNE